MTDEQSCMLINLDPQNIKNKWTLCYNTDMSGIVVSEIRPKKFERLFRVQQQENQAKFNEEQNTNFFGQQTYLPYFPFPTHSLCFPVIVCLMHQWSVCEEFDRVCKARIHLQQGGSNILFYQYLTQLHFKVGRRDKRMHAEHI